MWPFVLAEIGFWGGMLALGYFVVVFLDRRG